MITNRTYDRTIIHFDDQQRKIIYTFAACGICRTVYRVRCGIRHRFSIQLPFLLAFARKSLLILRLSFVSKCFMYAMHVLPIYE